MAYLRGRNRSRQAVVTHIPRRVCPGVMLAWRRGREQELYREVVETITAGELDCRVCSLVVHGCLCLAVALVVLVSLVRTCGRAQWMHLAVAAEICAHEPHPRTSTFRHGTGFCRCRGATCAGVFRSLTDAQLSPSSSLRRCRRHLRAHASSFSLTSPFLPSFSPSSSLLDHPPALPH